MKNTKRDALIKNIEETFQKGLEIMKKKNHDYAEDDDPFKNFKWAPLVGVNPIRGILVRITDKLARISSLLDKEAFVINESLEDTIIDGIVYLAILKAMLEEEK